MRRRLLFDFACSLRLIDGQAPLAFAPARLSVRRSPSRGAGAWEYLSITEQHVAGSYERHHVSIEGRRRNRWGIALRFTGRWTLFLSWSGQTHDVSFPLAPMCLDVEGLLRCE